MVVSSTDGSDQRQLRGMHDTIAVMLTCDARPMLKENLGKGQSLISTAHNWPPRRHMFAGDFPCALTLTSCGAEINRRVDHG